MYVCSYQKLLAKCTYIRTYVCHELCYKCHFVEFPKAIMSKIATIACCLATVH